MYFLLVRRRELGFAIPTDKLSKITPIRADVHLHECHSAALGRCCIEVWVFIIIPRLLDAKVNGMGSLGLNITGVEDVDGVLYAQEDRN
ncbi:hypothetical protein LZ838_06105 [Pseudomonas sp. AA27]|uniref:hypothetical protein n=1 Tax=Pseudomonas sp. AA27 TaxID=2908652 RepID=UPI001F260E37|nr:hypothetical protein [Pseudomonas sp. AA27]MCF1486928.1 hypothetical protein [Pseudomonas sp. AA27]